MSLRGSTSASVTTPYPWVTTAIGGRGLSGANYSASRTLRGLIPFASSTQGVLGSSAPEIGSSVNGATPGVKQIPENKKPALQGRECSRGTTLGDSHATVRLVTQQPPFIFGGPTAMRVT